MAKTKSSRRWLREHSDDEYVKKAQREGYRSRAVYKLVEIQQRDRVLRPGMTVIDLGAAPGGWSQVAAATVGVQGRVIAVDMLPMDPIPGVEVIQGDFREQAALDELLAVLGDRRADLVMSDMAPNISGMAAVDQPRAIHLAELALDLAHKVLKPGGDILVKVFQGAEFDSFRNELRAVFKEVQVRKPRASRPRSREIYLLARGYEL